MLSRSPSCGPWAPSPTAPISNLSDVAHGVAWDTHCKKSVTASREYIQNCLGSSYSDSGSELNAGCNMFNTPELNWTSTTVSCPFGDLCLGPPNSSLNMDTGLIDSRAGLGINSDDNSLVQWRKNTTCSPITTEGYVTSGVGQITAMPNNTYVDYLAAFYGHNGYSSQGINDSAVQNATYIYTQFREYVLGFTNTMGSFYDL
jgi:hypothetical protein